MTQPHGDLQLQQLRTLAAVGRWRSFSRAADELGYTQSAVSQQIRRLERAAGQVLVERPGGSRQVWLTPAGQLLVAHAEAIEARLASARADLDALAGGCAGTLRVGCYQSVGVRILPRLLAAFQTAWPQVRVELTEAEDDGELLRAIERGKLDLSFVVYPIPPGPFGHRELMEDPYVVVARTDGPLGAGRGPVRLPELADVPLVTYARMREVHAIENRLDRPELAGQVIFRSNDNGTILGLAAEGVGVAVISWLSVDPHGADVRVRPLADTAPRIIGIAWHRDRYRIAAAEAFVRLACQESLREHRTAAAKLGG
jgi:DNA-binding transcriptional LysR family regulator